MMTFLTGPCALQRYHGRGGADPQGEGGVDGVFRIERMLGNRSQIVVASSVF